MAPAEDEVMSITATGGDELEALGGKFFLSGLNETKNKSRWCGPAGREPESLATTSTGEEPALVGA